ncbi:MAG: type 2 isopentenyl-diphosphate Delta-isomerase [Actinomycetota bacterium]
MSGDAPGRDLTGARKADHLRIVLEEDVAGAGITTGLERVRFVHQALPEIDLADVDTSTTLLGRPLAAPLVISCMTGGVARGGEINRVLASAAQEAGVAMGLGSQRAALDDPALARTFAVRDVAPDVPLLANIGAAQLGAADAVAMCRRVVDMAQADALVIHANPLQEALQPEGTTAFAGLLDRIGEVAAALPVPVIVKEVGWGIAENVARELAARGVAGVDVAGAGGTSWSEVERRRIHDPVMARAAEAFRDWGIPTVDCVLGCRRALPDGIVIASGGLRTGVDVAKCIALGADAAALAAPLLHAAVAGRDAVRDALAVLIAGLRIAMFSVGAPTVTELRATPRISRTDTTGDPGSVQSTLP